MLTVDVLILENENAEFEVQIYSGRDKREQQLEKTFATEELALSYIDRLKDEKTFAVQELEIERKTLRERETLFAIVVNNGYYEGDRSFEGSANLSEANIFGSRIRAEKALENLKFAAKLRGEEEGSKSWSVAELDITVKIEARGDMK